MKTELDTKPVLEDILLALRRKIVEACRKNGLPQDITFSQMEVLKFIAQQQKVPMKDISTYLKITPPSASAVISEMEKKGFVSRIASPTDRRIVLITLTKKAGTLYEKMKKEKDTILQKMTARLTETDKKHLERIITILIAK